MATNIDKALYQTPLGLDSIVPESLGMPPDANEIEIEIVDPEEVNMSVDGVEISLIDRKSTRLNSSH